MEKQTSSDTQPKTTGTVTPPFSGPLAKFEAWLYDLLVSKAPVQLPPKAKEVLVTVAPWAVLVVAVLLLPTIFAVFSLGTTLSGVYDAYIIATAGPIYYVGIAILVVQVVLMALSIVPLMKRQRNGWLLAFYSSTISVVYSAVAALGYFNLGNLVMGLIGAAIGYYVLFQVRSYYKS